MDSLRERLRELRPKIMRPLKKYASMDNPAKRALSGRMTEEDMENYIVHYRKDKKRGGR